VSFVDGTGLATALMGDSIATNLFMVGYAWQRGLIPLSLEALHRAIELNGVAVEVNKRTLAWGRLAAHDPAEVEAQARPLMREESTALTLDQLVAHRAALLTDYQDKAYAERYRAFVAEVAAAEQGKAKGRTALTTAVARSLAKLMAYKDEYEVARLYVSDDFWSRIRAQFEGYVRLELNLAPPLLARRDPRTGELQKRPFGPWMFRAFRLLARLKRLRGTRWDVFGRTAERRAERRLIEDYRELIRELLADLGPHNHAVAVELAALPDHIRGFGHVKERSIASATQRQAELMTRFRAPAEPRIAAG
jgi:indolepyruvate ferredoxin oxidoreductase